MSNGIRTTMLPFNTVTEFNSQDAVVGVVNGKTRRIKISDLIVRVDPATLNIPVDNVVGHRDRVLEIMDDENVVRCVEREW